MTQILGYGFNQKKYEQMKLSHEIKPEGWKYTALNHFALRKLMVMYNW